MTNTHIYICNICNTLINNNACSCGNAATITAANGRVIHLFVDDINTVTAVNGYLDVDDKARLLNYTTPILTEVETGMPMAMSHQYINIANTYAKTYSLTNQETIDLFSK